MKLLLLSLLLALSGPLSAQDINLNDLYRQIDEAIAESPEYVALHERDIRERKTLLQRARTPQDKYEQAFRVYDLYKAYLSDSALKYIDLCARLADEMGQPLLRDRCRALQAFQCSTTGLYTESLGILNPIDSRRLDEDTRRVYYNACMHVCGELGYYTSLADMREYYQRLQRQYRDSLYAIVPHDSPDYLMPRINQLVVERQWKEATRLSDLWMSFVKPATRDYAIASYYRYLICNNQGRAEEAKYWLSQSALCDIRQAIMDQAALLSLAEYLNGEGDLERSYRYIRFTWDCNNRFNTRMRSWQITPILNVIERNYQSSVERNTRVLTASIVAVSILALLLLGALFFVHRRNKQLTTARKALNDTNAQLSELNRELQDTNAQLQERNHQAEVLNSRLSEANRVKEEYIGRFMSLCSQYINKLDDYRKMVNRKMKNKELDELFRISKSTELKEKELEELYENFDTVFLHLFPHFIEDFNALLQPDTQVHPKEENRLSTEVRIFALIRLGIEDSSKIAEFLHYSVNTIYNYRARIKNGSLGDREQFEASVKRLGLPK